MTPRNEVYTAIDGERDYQRERWGDFTDLHGRPVPPLNRSIDEFILYLEEYVLKARSASVSGDEAKGLDAVRKVAALAVACMEVHGAPQRKGFER